MTTPASPFVDSPEVTDQLFESHLLPGCGFLEHVAKAAKRRSPTITKLTGHTISFQEARYLTLTPHGNTPEGFRVDGKASIITGGLELDGDRTEFAIIGALIHYRDLDPREAHRSSGDSGHWRACSRSVSMPLFPPGAIEDSFHSRWLRRAHDIL